jgi:hypothetical protein
MTVREENDGEENQAGDEGTEAFRSERRATPLWRFCAKRFRYSPTCETLFGILGYCANLVG